ncbi:MAG: cobalamin-binding protein [Anaerolinea sp.]|nr:cobalamin-binding protein [Anaerolinea sp.]
MLEQIVADFNEAVFDTDREKALNVVHAALKKGVTPEEIIFQIVIPSLSYFLKGVSDGQDINLAQHFMTSQIATEVTEEMVEKFQKAPEIIGRIVIGTAYGDLHSLGKRIVIGCLRSQMIEVSDLGVNVLPEKFVEEALAKQAQVIGISTMMVHTARGENGCLKVREILKQRGLEGQIKLIVGGAPYNFDHELYRTVQADAWAEDGLAAGKVITALIKEIQP